MVFRVLFLLYPEYAITRLFLSFPSDRSQTREWKQPQTFGESPVGRRSHSAFVHENLVYIFGGYNGNEELHYADLWSLDPRSFTWKKLKPRGGIPTQTMTPTAVRASPHMVLPAPPHPEAQGGAGDPLPGNLVNEEAGGGNGVVAPAAEPDAIGQPSQVHRAPCARRRQCCCVVKDSVILFGGTSPAVEPVEDSEFNLMDHSDLYVLDFYPSLKTLCMLTVVDNKLDTSLLPRDLQWDILSMTTNSNISRPLANNG